MRESVKKHLWGLLFLAFIASCAPETEADLTNEFVAVASQNASKIQVLDLTSNEVIDSRAINRGGQIEQMIYSPRHKKMFALDKNNDRILVYETHFFLLIGEINVEGKVTDMEPDKLGKFLWLAHEDGAVSKINIEFGDVILRAKVDIPGLSNLQAKSIMTSPEGEYVYLTYKKQGNDLLVALNSQNLEVENTQEINKNASLYFSGKTDRLYAISRDSESIMEFKPDLEVTQQRYIDCDYLLGINTRGTHFFYAKGNDVMAYDVQNLQGRKVYSGSSAPGEISTNFFDSQAYISFPSENKVDVVELGIDRSSMTFNASQTVNYQPNSLEFYSAPGTCSYERAQVNY